MNDNYNQNMDGRPPSSTSGQSPPGVNDPNYLQQMFTADVAAMQQQQQQPYFYNPAFANQAAVAAQGGMMAFDPTQLMNAPQIQQQFMQNLSAFAGDNGGNAIVNPFQMSMQNSLQQQQPPPANAAGQSFLQYDPATTAPIPMPPQNEVSDIGGVAVPPMAAGTPSILRVEAAAMAAATAAAPSRKRKSTKRGESGTAKSRKKASASDDNDNQTTPLSASATALIDNAMLQSNQEQTTAQSHPDGNNNAHQDERDANTMTAEEQKAQSSRDRNREHARCTRLRKKAYVNKLKELVDGLHSERSEDARKRRAAVRNLAECQEKRRKIVHVFLGYHASYEEDVEKWKSVLEEEFWMKQPVTPFRSFRRCEIDKGSRILKGIDAVIGDAASMSVMIETIGSRNLRWLQRKRDNFFTHPSSFCKHRTLSKRNSSNHRSNTNSSNSRSDNTSAMPHNIMQNGSRLQHAISSLSSGSSTGSSDEAHSHSDVVGIVQSCKKKRKKDRSSTNTNTTGVVTTEDVASSLNTTNDIDKSNAKKVSSSSSSNDTRKFVVASSQEVNSNANDFHDYHAPSLPDPLLDSGGSSPESDSPHDGDSDHCVVMKHMCTDMSLGDGDTDKPNTNEVAAGAVAGDESKSTSGSVTQSIAKLPPNIARFGGISHNVTATTMPSAVSLPNGHAQLSRAPITALPPFAGIGKKAPSITTQSNTSQPTSEKKTPSFLPNVPIDAQKKSISNSSRSNRSHSHSNLRGSNIITIDNDTTSSQSSTQKNRGIQAYYHINEDDMCMTDDVLMCPFTFRSLDAVWCGALAECVMPGMLRVCFSKNNKLKSVEMIFDAMGFCQQLEHASGNLGMAQIIPNCLEMALVPNSEEARVITLAIEPYAIVSVNEAWTRMTGYTQLDVEGKNLTILHGERTDPNAGNRSGLPTHDFASVSRGISACSVNMNYDANGREFLNFVCSYPLTNPNDEVTHLLHVCQELPARS